MKTLNEAQIADIALRLTLFHYDKNGCPVGDELKSIIRTTVRLSGIEEKLVVRFFASVIIPRSAKKTFGWESCDDNSPGLERATRERIALALVKQEAKEKGLTLGPELKSRIPKIAEETTIPTDELKLFFGTYFLPLVVQNQLGLDGWAIKHTVKSD